MHYKSDNMEIMIYGKADEIVKDLFESLLSIYQTGLEASMKSSNFIFDFNNLLHYKCHKRNLECGGSNADSPDWINNKKATTNPVYDDNKCLRSAATVTSNYEEIEQDSGRIRKIKIFLKSNWGGISYPSRKDDWKKFEKIT